MAAPREIDRLDPQMEIAKGSERHVYRVETAPDLLLKVMRDKHLKRISNVDDRCFRNWLQVRKTYALFRREMKTWTDAMQRAAVRGARPPLAAIGNLVLTPKGLGQYVEHVRTLKGDTAPTLHDLAVETTLSETHFAALNVFVAALYDWHIPAYDLGPKNIVWKEAEQRFVLVDGFGDRAALPLVTWSRFCNNWKLDRSFEKTAEKFPLIWNRSARRFERAS